MDKYMMTANQLDSDARTDWIDSIPLMKAFDQREQAEGVCIIGLILGFVISFVSIPLKITTTISPITIELSGLNTDYIFYALIIALVSLAIGYAGLLYSRMICRKIEVLRK